MPARQAPYHGQRLTVPFLCLASDAGSGPVAQTGLEFTQASNVCSSCLSPWVAGHSLCPGPALSLFLCAAVSCVLLMLFDDISKLKEWGGGEGVVLSG